MKAFFRVFILFLLIGVLAFYNFGLVDIRFEEIRYLLGNIESQEEASNTFGIVEKYELIKRRMTEGEDHVSTYELEARIQALTSGDQAAKNRNTWNYRAYRMPIRYLVNAVRILLGKRLINPKEDDKIYKVLEIGYFWERNRKYHEALKVYEDVIKTAGVDHDIKSAVMVHKGFCVSMLGNYKESKLVYEQVINLYPNTDAGVLSWKLLDFIQHMEKGRIALDRAQLSEMEKARQFFLVMDFRNAIRNYSKFLENKTTSEVESQARYYKGRAHEELGETEDAINEYRRTIRIDTKKEWARKANRRMLMIGQFYEQQKSITDEAKRQLEAYQDQNFYDNMQQYAQLVSRSSLRSELMKEAGPTQNQVIRDSLLNAILNIGDLDLTGEKTLAAQQKKLDSIRNDLIDKGRITPAEMVELQRRQNLTLNPYRRPNMLKTTIDGYSNELKYLYNKRLRSGVKLTGKMLVEIKIMPDGSVGSTAIVKSNLGDQSFEKSVQDRILTWKFHPVPDSFGSFDIRYPFEFAEEE